MSNNETKTVQLKIVSPVAKKFIDTLVQKVTEEGWTYNYDKVFTNPYKVFLTKEVYINSEEPDITVVTGDFRKASAVEQANLAEANHLLDKMENLLDTLANINQDFSEVLLPDAYDPENVSIVIGGEVIKGFSPEDTPESIIPIPDEPVSYLVEEVIAESPLELIEPTDAGNGLQEKIGDGNVYTLELLKDIQWHKLTKIGSAYGLHAMKRGDMEAAIVNLSQGNKVDE